MMFLSLFSCYSKDLMDALSSCHFPNKNDNDDNDMSNAVRKLTKPMTIVISRSLILPLYRVFCYIETVVAL